MVFGATAQAEVQAEAQALTPEVAGRIISCKISGDKQNVEIKSSNAGDATGTDGNTYVFKTQPCEEGLGSHSNSIASSPTLNAASVSVPLNLGIPQDKLYSRFILVVFDGTKFVRVSQPHYIVNPELTAKNQTSSNDLLTKRGSTIEVDMFSGAFDLDVKHVTTNIVFPQTMGAGIDYQYNGKTHHFGKSVVDAYDKTISALSDKGMMVTIILPNDQNPNTPDLIYPGVQKNPSALYYMFNAETEAGSDQTKAVASFLAQHYSGGNPSYGKVSNWIIGNKINSQQWNYMGTMDLTSYVKTYQKALRVIYTTVKSTSVNDRIHSSPDYSRMNEIGGKLKCGGREVVDSSSSIVNIQGQMDWGSAYHPYPCPMTGPEFWDDPQSTGLPINDFSSPVINFANLDVLTGYFVQDILRAPGGNVRHVIPTEQGLTSYSPTGGNIPGIQAAAYAHSYYLVDNNPYTDTYTVSRQVDAPSEARDGLKFGLWECDMNQPNLTVATKRKEIWQVPQNVDKRNATLEATEFAKPIIDISKQLDVVPNFKWKNLEE